MSDDLEAHEYHRFMTERDQRILALCNKIIENADYLRHLDISEEIPCAIHEDAHLIKREVSNG